MSWHYLAGQAEESSEDISLAGDAWEQWKSSLTQEESCSHANGTESSHGSPSGTTLKPSRRKTRSVRNSSNGCEESENNSSSREASPARESASPAKDSGLTTQEAGSGQKWRGSFAKLDPLTRLWKTVQCSLFEDLETFCETWPRWGIMQDGECFRLSCLEHPTCEKEFGLLPTPNSTDNRDRGNLNHASVQRRIRIGKQVGLSMLFEKEPCPMCVEGIMGFPSGWSDVQPLAMPKFQSWLEAHGKH